MNVKATVRFAAMCLLLGLGACGGDDGATTPPPPPPVTGIDPAGFTGAGQMFAFTPHGTTFVIPVTMTLPFDPASVTGGTLVAVYKTNAQSQ